MRWLSAVGKKTLDGRRPGRGINPVAVDEMKGSWSGTVDESRPYLAVDDGVGVAAPARWRMVWRTEEAGRSGEVIMAPMVYEWGNGGEGDLKLWDALL